MKIVKFLLPPGQKVDLDDAGHRVEGPCIAVVLAEDYEHAKKLLAEESPTPYMVGWLESQKTQVTVIDLGAVNPYAKPQVVTVFM